MSYTTATQVSNFLGRPLTQYETDELTNIIAAVKIWLDKRLNSTFDQVSATTRYYDGGFRNLDIDPCTAITEVKSINDDTTSSYIYTDGTEYVAEPQNETVKRELRKRLTPFPKGIHRVAVTAQFSEYDGGVPADIQIVATRLAAGVLKAGTNVSAGEVKSESLEGHSITYETNANNLEGIATGDATVSNILVSRQELLIDNYTPENDRYENYEGEGGLLL
jgi:hypothetical protein